MFVPQIFAIMRKLHAMTCAKCIFVSLLTFVFLVLKKIKLLLILMEVVSSAHLKMFYLDIQLVSPFLP